MRFFPTFIAIKLKKIKQIILSGCDLGYIFVNSFTIQIVTVLYQIRASTNFNLIFCKLYRYSTYTSTLKESRW